MIVMAPTHNAGGFMPRAACRRIIIEQRVVVRQFGHVGGMTAGRAALIVCRSLNIKVNISRIDDTIHINILNSYYL